MTFVGYTHDLNDRSFDMRFLKRDCSKFHKICRVQIRLGIEDEFEVWPLNTPNIAK